MNDISELKIAIDKANREMYEAFSARQYERAAEIANEIQRLGMEAKWGITWTSMPVLPKT